MALHGKNGANPQVIHVGSTEEEVQTQLGTPVESRTTDWGGKTAVYEYELGYEPSVGLAFGNLLIDFYSLGFYELVWSIRELTQDRSRLPIYFGPDGRVAGINETAPETPPLAVAEPGSQPVSPLPRKPKERQALVSVSDVDRVPTTEEGTRLNAYAVVIGIAAYRDKLPRADFADHDAQVMGQYLTKVMGYKEENVVVLLNERATKSDIEKYVERMASKPSREKQLRVSLLFRPWSAKPKNRTSLSSTLGWGSYFSGANGIFSTSDVRTTWLPPS